MDDFADNTSGARSISATLSDLLTGSFKLLVILFPVWLPALWLFGGTGDCRGDCGVGMGMLFIALAVYFGPILLLIGVPIALGLLVWWTRERPLQLLGGIAFIPLLLAGWWGFSHTRDAVVSSKIEAAIRPEYLSRTIADPVGRLELVVAVGEGGDCSENCYKILVNGIALKYSNGHLNNNGGSQKFFEKIFSLSSGEKCLAKVNLTQSSVEYLQSRGVFDACIIDARADPPIAAIAIRGFQYDRNLLARPYGLQGVRVLQAITDAGLGQELVRWEYGTLPGTQKRIGTPAEWEDLIRAYTGISTDRFADAQKLDHSQRMDAILRSAENPPLQLYPVFKYLREASDASEFRFARKGSNLRQLTDEEATKLKAIGTRICSATPVVKSYSSKQVDCPKAYNELIRNAYPEQADALML